MNPFRLLSRIASSLERMEALAGRGAREARSHMIETQHKLDRALAALEGRAPPPEPVPLLRAPKTYNTGHPDYDANAVRNYPGRLSNWHLKTENRAFHALTKWLHNEGPHDVPQYRMSDTAAADFLHGIRRAIDHDPLTYEIQKRRAYVDAYADEIGPKYGAEYHPGWVNMDDALFLYWLVRTQRPRTIVQTGVSNGLSTAFMALALHHNGPNGHLYAIDLPHVFDPNDPAWTKRGETYGVMIPEGKSSGWLVPDELRDRVDIHYGDAKADLPWRVETVPSIDLFFHDSDHTYDHMMFEFNTVHPKLAHGGLIVADDISWNASLWDFADEHKVPAFNFKGAVGVAFF